MVISRWTYACMHSTCMSMHTHAHTHPHTHMCTHTRTHTWACTHAYARAHTHTHAHTYTHTHTHTHTHTQKNVHAYLCTCVRTHTHTHTHNCHTHERHVCISSHCHTRYALGTFQQETSRSCRELELWLWVNRAIKYPVELRCAWSERFSQRLLCHCSWRVDKGFWSLLVVAVMSDLLGICQSVFAKATDTAVWSEHQDFIASYEHRLLSVSFSSISVSCESTHRHMHTHTHTHMHTQTHTHMHA